VADKLLLEDGSSRLLLEDGTSFLELESMGQVGAPAPLPSIGLLLASSSGFKPAWASFATTIVGGGMNA
jgi:hypothetical protein